MPIEVDFQPIGRHVQVEPGATVLDAAQKAGVGLSAVCGGGGSCGTCLVRLSAGAPVSPPNAIERSELDPDDLAAGLRLACQVELHGPTRVDVPPESLTALQRTQVEGEERPVELAPPVLACDLTLPPAAQTDLRADWERLSDALIAAGALPAGQPPRRPLLPVMRALPALLRENDWGVRVGLRGDQVVSVTAPDVPLLGLAVDIGTTKVAGYLVDLTTGATLAMRGLMNPQIAYGEDVMARIAHTIEHQQGLQVLQTAIVDALNELARDLCAGATHLTGALHLHDPDPSHIVEAVVVGNTAMHHLFLGLPVKQLGLAPYVAAVSSPLDVAASQVGLQLAPGATVHLLPNIAGFVGADHVSMLLATNAHEPPSLPSGQFVPRSEAETGGIEVGPSSPPEGGTEGGPSSLPVGGTGGEPSSSPVGETGGEPSSSSPGRTEGGPSSPSLRRTEGGPSSPPVGGTEGGTREPVIIRLDIGTNTEITLAAGGRLIACSTASGPAFEGAHIRDGMRAAEGAIERVRVSDGKLEYQTIGGGPPVGICGSGILDAIAQLKLAGALNHRGAMDPHHPLVRQGDNGPEVVLAPAPLTRHGRDVLLNRKDVSEIQLSKGAMRAGIEILLQQFDLVADDIDRFIIAGAFGTYIDVASAVSIGMFPALPLERFRQVGNAAGIGAKLALLSSVQRAAATALAARVEYLELTNYPDFTNEFAKAMSL